MLGFLRRLLGPTGSISQREANEWLGYCKENPMVAFPGGALTKIVNTPEGVAAILSAEDNGESAIYILIKLCEKYRIISGPNGALANIANTPEGLEAIAACLDVKIGGRTVFFILNAVIKDVPADYAKASVLGILAKKVPGVRERLAKEPGGSPKLGIDAIAHPVAASTALGASAPLVAASVAREAATPPVVTIPPGSEIISLLSACI